MLRAEQNAKSQQPKAESQPVKAEPLVETELNISPLAKKLMQENNVSEADFVNFMKGFRVGKKDVEFFLSSDSIPQATTTSSWGGTRDTEKKKMSTLRLKLADRLVSVKNETAMLTTFNEVNMTPIMEIRKKYKEIFKEKHGVSLGFMSFFTKAVTEALNIVPGVMLKLMEMRLFIFIMQILV